jgi:mono/diheme cytochrome c family protein
MHKTAFILALFTIASPLWAEAPAGLLPYTDEAAIANGRAIYEAQCAACHGIDLGGEANWRDRDANGYMPAPPHDETGHTWHHPDTQLFMITKHGTEMIVGNGYKSNMMGFGDILTDHEILEVLAYIKSTWPRRVVQTHNRINRDALGQSN